MMRKRILLKIVPLALLFSFPLTAMAGQDKKSTAFDNVKGDLSVMVLGSGGPVATPAGRASASYLVFVDGVPRILMDAGGGAYKSLAMAGVDIKDLDIVLLSHLHLDHTGDLPSIIKSMYFNNSTYNLKQKPSAFPPGRTAPFRVFGPGANRVPFPLDIGANEGVAQYPATSAYVYKHFDLNTGVERYLNVFSRAINGGTFNYEAHNISPNWQVYNPTNITPSGVDGLVIKAVGVNHGPVPALAFRIEYKGLTIVYSGDTSSKKTNMKGNPLLNGGNMMGISEGADLLIYDTSLATDTLPNPSLKVFYNLHTTPSRIGEVAHKANVKTLLLSHITPLTEGKIPQVETLIRAQGFTGKILEANDLQVINFEQYDH
ncbi:MBL fold metallo-hydrolase [Thiomicrorhabdus arctica]|jgi:ribonuclease BN (tRNA processing enzyme)|uniref:MBL fold metallo-hydrolase n=1 Tax=Thiomicrorhabdus arctica TaxID=131540 RepID=UPI000373B100|nr:MBL fold metallo-hydrolase [Thiomicrorhabdus arctica]